MSSQATHIRVTLNDELTWAEREAFAEYLNNSEDVLGHSVQKKNGSPRVVNVYSLTLDSRELYKLVHSILALEFTNLYIKSVQTVYPKVKV